MNANATNIWSVPAYLSYVQPALTRQALLDAESQIGFKLPQEYIELLAERNGGYIRWRLYGEVHNIIRGIGPHYPALEVEDWTTHGDWLPFDLKSGNFLVPFDGDGHWHLCLDYRRDRSRPSITKVDTEGVSEEAIADSFADYLQILEPDIDENDFVLPGVSNLESLTAWLGKELKMTVDPPSEERSSYPQYRLRREGLEYPECLWLSPNLVPRSFVAKNDERYAEVKDWMPGFARRFPGIAEESWIMTSSENIVPEVLATLDGAGVKWVQLEPQHAFGN